MTRSSIRVGALLALVTSTIGCNAARAFVASPGDYADYRRVRLGRTLDERLAAASEYLEARPDGRYATRLGNYFRAAEPVYFRVRSRSVAGLEAYLAALPHGPHANEALDELVRLRNERRREDAVVRGTDATLRRVESENRARKAAAELVVWWSNAMLTPELWSKTYADAPAELLARFRMTAPEPSCVRVDGAEHCVKEVVRNFRVRGPGGPVERQLRARIELDLDPGYRLVAFSLSGEGLGLASAEAASGAVRFEESEEQAWRKLVEGLGARLFAEGRPCSGGEDETGAYRLACDDPRVTLTAIRDARGDEAIYVTRAAVEATASPERP